MHNSPVGLFWIKYKNLKTPVGTFHVCCWYFLFTYLISGWRCNFWLFQSIQKVSSWLICSNFIHAGKVLGWIYGIKTLKWVLYITATVVADRLRTVQDSCWMADSNFLKDACTAQPLGSQSQTYNIWILKLCVRTSVIPDYLL